MLSNQIKSFLFWKMGIIIEEHHMKNIHDDKFYKVDEIL
jgi:hypothetical protein